MTSNKCDHKTEGGNILSSDFVCLECGQRFVPVPDGAEVVFLETARESGSDLDCDGKPWQHELKCDVSERFHFCPGCDARYVPSDVLEEREGILVSAGAALRLVEWNGRANSDRCPDCFSEKPRHAPTCLLFDVLARIDAALGKK